MINKDNKKYLFWIMEYYLSKKIDGEAFSHAFHESYDLDLDYTCLTEKEQKVFNELNAVVGRYTPYETDLINYPGIYYNDEQLQKAVQKAKNELPYELGLEKYAIRFLCSFFKLYNAYLSKVEINEIGINGIICYEYDEQTQEFFGPCPLDKRIKSAIDFLDFVIDRHLIIGDSITTNKEDIIQLLLNEGWLENKIHDSWDFIFHLNIQMIDEGCITGQFVIHT